MTSNDILVLLIKTSSEKASTATKRIAKNVCDCHRTEKNKMS